MINAIHSFWSKPGKVKNYGQIIIPDYELFGMILSALEWRKYNGSIYMITDTEGAEFFYRSGLDGLWDYSIDTFLDNIPESIDPFMFWAAGKIYALERMHPPCAILDIDLIFWKDISPLLSDAVVAAHSECLSEEVYPTPHMFSLKSGYAFPQEWDFTLEAANTAFLYMPNAEILNDYTRLSIDFMNAFLPQKIHPTVAMCFAEQRILPMCVKAKNMQLNYLVSPSELHVQNFVTHLWGYKRELRYSPKLRKQFCVRCANRIKRDFPEWGAVISRSDLLKKYW